MSVVSPGERSKDNMIRYSDKVFYEVYPSSFCDSNDDGIGDLKGIESKLDYIKNLGFDGIWINPIFASPFKDGGYDISDFFKVDKRFGTLKDLKSLIQKCHEKEMMILLDLVPGHASTKAEIFLKSAEPTKNEYSDLFIWNDSTWNNSSNGKFISGCYDRDGCYMVNFFAHQAAINYGFAEVNEKWQQKYNPDNCPGRKFITSVIKYYLELGIDGYRVDMADSLVKGEDDKECTIDLWQKIFADIRKDYPNAYFVSEWSNPSRALRAGFNADFVLDHHDNCSHYLFREDGERKPLLVSYDKKLYNLFKKDLLKRIEEANKYEGNLAFISGNHDTYRLADYLKENELKLAYIFLLTMPGNPFIFAGDELGQKTNRNLLSKEGGYQRTGTRIPMVFDETEGRGFTKNIENSYLPIDTNTISAKKAQEDDKSLLNLIKTLIALRKENEVLSTKEFKLLDHPLAYRRGNILVFINLLDVEQKIEVSTGDIIFKTDNVDYCRGSIVVKPHQAIIYKEYN